MSALGISEICKSVKCRDKYSLQIHHVWGYQFCRFGGGGMEEDVCCGIFGLAFVQNEHSPVKTEENVKQIKKMNFF